MTFGFPPRQKVDRFLAENGFDSIQILFNNLSFRDVWNMRNTRLDQRNRRAGSAEPEDCPA